MRRARYQVGDKVIARSNEPGPYLVGVVLIADTLPNSSTPIPTIVVGEEEFTVFGIVHPYSELKCQALDKLEWWEQWNVMATGMYFIDPSSDKVLKA